MVEFALIAPFVFLVLYLVIEMGRAGLDANAVANAAREGTRTAVAAQEAGNSSANIQQDVISSIQRTLGGGMVLDTTVHPQGATCSMGQPGVVTVYMSPAPGTVPGGTTNPRVTVEVCYVFQPWVGLVQTVTGSRIVLDTQSTMKTEY